VLENLDLPERAEIRVPQGHLVQLDLLDLLVLLDCWEPLDPMGNKETKVLSAILEVRDR